MVQQGWKDKISREEPNPEGAIERLEARDKHRQIVELLLGSSKFGETWLRFVDTDAYGNNLLHVCVELHSEAYARIVLAKCRELGVDLMSQSNANGFKPLDLLA